MKKPRTLFALFLVLSLLFTLTACGSATASAPAAASDPVAEASDEPAAAPEQAAEEEDSALPEDEDEASAVDSAVEPTEAPIEISYPLFDELHTYTIWMGTAPDLSEVVSEMDQYIIFRELQKITNVGWDATMVSFMAESEQFQLMLASGDFTDVVCKAVDNYNGTVDQAIEEEFLIDVGPYIHDNMPNLSAKMDAYPELRLKLSSNEGAIGGFPKIYADYSDISSGGMIRQDWLTDLKLENPKTFDDLYDVLNTFRKEKGAENPLIIYMNTGIQADLVYGYGIGPGFYQVDDEVRYGAIQPEFKDYLTMINKWYSEGLINDLFLTNPYQSLIDTTPVLNNECGVWYGNSAQSLSYLIPYATDPNMQITGLTTPTLDGSQAHLGEVGSIYDSTMWSITTVCEDPEVICQYIDYVYSDDGIMLANYGVEGECFEYDETGTPRLTDLVLNNPEYSYGAAMNMFVCDRMTPAPFVIDENRVRADYIPDQLSCIEVWNNANDGKYNMPSAGVNLTIEESDEYLSLYSDIETYLDENTVKFVVGDKSLDEFDDFVATLKQMGIERCVELEQAAYDRYLAG